MLSLWRHLDQTRPARDTYLGIDIGGTFTDLVLMDAEGSISTAKAPTTPGELEKGVFDAVAVAAAAQGLAAEELLGRVTAFGHGTTQATPAIRHSRDAGKLRR